MINNAQEITKKALMYGAIRIRPENPFYCSELDSQIPISTDTQLLLSDSNTRKLVINGLVTCIEEKIKIDKDLIILGTSTVEIPWAAFLAEKFGISMVSIRDKSKDHDFVGTFKGLDPGKDFEGRRVIIIEDLMSNGRTAIKTVKAVREAKGKVEYCFSIFDYGFPETKKSFDELNPACEVVLLVNYATLLEVAMSEKYISQEQLSRLQTWSLDRFAWKQQSLLLQD